MMKDTIGGLSLVKLDISGYNLTYKSLFFSTDKCLQSKQKILDIYTSPIRRGKNRLLSSSSLLQKRCLKAYPHLSSPYTNQFLLVKHVSQKL